LADSKGIPVGWIFGFKLFAGIGGQHGMARPISMDLRERLVLAVERERISARAAAARFDVSVSSAIKWVRRYRETGNVAPGKMGGHKPNILSGLEADWLIERTRTDLTLRGLVAELGERGVQVD
jgi:transposase